MGRKSKNSLPFDRRGSAVVFNTYLLNSKKYLALRPQAKVLITLLQIHWRNDKPVDYGIREAAEKILCDERTAAKAFRQLQEGKFITCVEESVFNSRTGSKSRSWRLEWMPFNHNKPNNYWDKTAGE